MASWLQDCVLSRYTIICHYIMTYNHIGPAELEIGSEGQTRALLSALCQRVCGQLLSQQLSFKFNLDFWPKSVWSVVPKLEEKLHLSESALSCTKPNLKSVQQPTDQVVANHSQAGFTLSRYMLARSMQT